ncbi:uncharacterized protein LOC129778422 [Toxorhynchites rutilus septentrionalis]|uniref:uncharacterized protein LOC129778422 n=1 Tax=Toxorhynchites rutilus septentrionalis TaxID=329112 RepID=UPI00247ADAE4|nr:uncharacterized protein LOC129778422 [Toxorhynchites rutilus septentrionalis]
MNRLSFAIILFFLSQLANGQNWASSSCQGYGCATQQGGCVPFKFWQHQCSRVCHYNTCSAASSPRRVCYKLIHLATGKCLVSRNVYDVYRSQKYATVAVNGPFKSSWNLEPGYQGGTYYIRNSQTLEFLRVGPNNRIYLVRDQLLDVTFQFRPVHRGVAWSQFQLQAVCNNGYLYVGGQTGGEGLVQITFEPNRNYYNTLWGVTSFYC